MLSYIMRGSNRKGGINSSKGKKIYTLLHNLYLKEKK